MSEADIPRVRALRDLVELRVTARDAQLRLAAVAWDEEELLDLEVRHLVGVLERFVAGELGAAELTEWADTVHLRDDIGRESGRAVLINNVLFALSRPELQDESLSATASRVLTALRPGPRS